MKRDMAHAKIAGVCAGIANHFGFSHMTVRLIFIIAVVLGTGFPVLLYLLLWLVMDKE